MVIISEYTLTYKADSGVFCYESNAERYAAETFSADMSEQYRRFLPLLKDGAKILDVGSGSGRDACYFQKHGYQVTALEPSKNLGREIRKVFSGEIVCFDIQNYQPTERYDGIWACASLIHLQEEEVLCFFRKIDMYLNDNGIVYVSGKSGISTGEVEDGRFFLEFTEQLVEKILTVNKQLQLEQLWYTEDVSGRRGFRWLNMVFAFCGAQRTPMRFRADVVRNITDALKHLLL